MLEVNRRIVLHEVHNKFLQHIQQGDSLFFDDCTYAQYLFLKKNLKQLQELGTKCFLGFSTSLHREDRNASKIGMTTQVLHDAFHSGDLSVLDYFMTIEELKNLLQQPNFFLAAHGDEHLKLESCSSKVMQMQKFHQDVKAMVEKLSSMHLHTSTFVYPYTYVPILSEKILRDFGFQQLYGCNGNFRISIENLAEGKFIADS